MKLKYKLKKLYVRIKEKSKDKNKSKILKKFTKEQTKIFNLVSTLAIQDKSSIKFDNQTSEVLLILPKMLITLNGNNVSIDNTTGFLSIDFPIEGFNLLVEVINKEAHKERRRLKHEVKLRIHDFIDNIIKTGEISHE
jgi:hypothetical protein